MRKARRTSVTEAHFAPESMAQDAPLCGLQPLEGGDTWITVGEPETEEERTVTVVFRRDPLDEVDPLDVETGEFLVRPLAPMFPGRR
jgi:hypothetical protein